MKETIIALFIVIAITGSCRFSGDNCDMLLPQKWHIGELEAELITNKPVLKIGDTLLFRFKLNKRLLDTAGKEMDIDEGIQVFHKITTTANLTDTTSSDFFTTDTTIFKVFDQYFDMKLIKGDTINVYMHECELIDDFWEIEAQYIAKKPGNYSAGVAFWQIAISESKLGSVKCMEGDTETFGAKLLWKESEHNRIDVLFQDKKEKYPEYFGFIVED